MNVKEIYKPHRLNSTLKELAPRFFLPAEFPERKPVEYVSHLLEKAASLTTGELKRFSILLKSAELDSLILYLPNASEDEKKRITFILQQRASKRILELFWPFFQYHFENENVIGTAKALLLNIPGGMVDSIAYRNLSLFTSSNGFELMIKRLNEAAMPLAIISAKEALLLESPLASKVFEAFFCQCGSDGFLMNEKRLLHILTTTSMQSAKSILVNYLDRLDRLEFLLNVNNYIVDRWGEPSGSVEWLSVPPSLRQKFTEWISYRRLAEHFGKNKLKLRILNNVVPQIHQVQLSNDGKFMAADFGEFLIVDDNESSSYSYLIEKSLYERISGDSVNSGIENIKITEKKITDARDFIIEEAEDGFMQLEYEDLGRLYIMDMLNIKLKLAPDIRPSKSLIRKKRQINEKR